MRHIPIMTFRTLSRPLSFRSTPKRASGAVPPCASNTTKRWRSVGLVNVSPQPRANRGETGPTSVRLEPDDPALPVCLQSAVLAAAETQRATRKKGIARLSKVRSTSRARSSWRSSTTNRPTRSAPSCRWNRRYFGVRAAVAYCWSFPKQPTSSIQPSCPRFRRHANNRFFRLSAGGREKTSLTVTRRLSISGP